MESEERYLKERVGQVQPFKVPDGYFDSLTERVMNHLLAPQQKKSRLVALRPWLYAAACLVVLVVMSVTLLFPKQTEVPQVVATAVVESSYMDEAADYAMLDNAEIYACLSDN